MIKKKRYTPTKQHLLKAYKLYKRNFRIKDIIIKLGISKNRWTKHKEIFFQFFRQEDERIELEELRNRGRGRPKGQRKLTLEKRRKILDCLENDMTIELSARIVGVHRDTIYAWCKEYPEFKRQMDIAKDKGIQNVKKMLGKSAKGGYVIEVTTKEYLDKNDNVISKEVQKKKKHVKANVTAQQFILVNRAGWVHDSEGKKTNNKGEILDALEKMNDITDEEMEEFDNE